MFTFILGSLFDQIQQRGHFNEGEASEIIRELAEGVAFLHRKGIAHRDLKPENILCEEEDSVTPVRICDFDLGNAIVLKKESAVTTPELMTPVSDKISQISQNQILLNSIYQLFYKFYE